MDARPKDPSRRPTRRPTGREGEYREAMDSLSAILGSVRLASTAISSASFTAPWSVHTIGAPCGVFHALLEGSAWIIAGDQPPVRLAEGDVAVLPTGGAHTLCDDPRTPPVRVR